MMAIPLILRLDVAGAPIRWIPWQEAICLYARDMVAWTAGDRDFTFHGGICRRTGLRSELSVNSIVAIKRSSYYKHLKRSIPPLSNRELFLRDGHICMYCGNQYPDTQLTRDHVIPLSRGGRDRWSNVVAACRGCNTRKGNRSPEQAGVSLLAIPYVPNWAEFLALSNRRILADQMEFLQSQFKSRKRLLSLQ
jgi:5-methylcytosine-specific restriction endonuclease McrA